MITGTNNSFNLDVAFECCPDKEKAFTGDIFRTWKREHIKSLSTEP